MTLSTVVTFGVFVILPLFCRAQSSKCDPTVPGPLSLPIQNVSLTAPALRRGIPIAVGTPPQKLAFMAHGAVNNSFIYDTTGQCDDNVTPIQCLALNGGAFKENLSGTWKSRDLNDDKTKEQSFYNVTIDLFGVDTLQLNESSSIEDFPIHVVRNRGNRFDMNSLGLGQDSAILNALVKSGAIASRSWSYFWGLEGADSDHQMDGSLVLGGYDAAKFTGENLTQKFTTHPDCISSLVATVTNMEIQSGGEVVSLFGEGPEKTDFIRFCVDAAYPIITIPEEVGNVFREKGSGAPELGRAFGINLFGLLYNINLPYQGDLAITFDSGLKITIPNHQLVVPDISINPEGKTVANTTTREILLNPLQEINANNIPRLGRTFLTSAYLSVNHDTSTFSLWQANPTTEQKLIGIGPDGIGCQHQSATADEADDGKEKGTSDQANPPPTSAAPKKPLSGPAWAGIAVGIAALIALVAVAYYLRRRRRHMWREQQLRLAAEYDSTKPELSAGGDHVVSGKPSSYTYPARGLQEMPGDVSYGEARRWTRAELR